MLLPFQEPFIRTNRKLEDIAFAQYYGPQVGWLAEVLAALDSSAATTPPTPGAEATASGDDVQVGSWDFMHVWCLGA